MKYTVGAFFKRAYDMAGGALVGAALAGMIGGVAAQGFILPNLTALIGHMQVQGAPPVLTGCGTTPAITGTDSDGTVTMGTTATGCVITFAVAYVGVPNCVINWQGTPLVAQNWTVTNTAITTVQTSASNNKLNYHCVAPAGG